MIGNTSQTPTAPTDIEAVLRSLADRAFDDRLRTFGCECCERARRLIAASHFDTLLAYGRARASGQVDYDTLASLRAEANRFYDSLYPGYGATSAFALAFIAAGEVAFTERALDAAVNSSMFAAQAIATAAADAGEDATYDKTYEEAFTSERAVQEAILRTHLR
jgi:hypothetical protein